MSVNQLLLHLSASNNYCPNEMIRRQKREFKYLIEKFTDSRTWANLLNGLIILANLPPKNTPPLELPPPPPPGVVGLWSGGGDDGKFSRGICLVGMTAAEEALRNKIWSMSPPLAATMGSVAGGWLGWRKALEKRVWKRLTGVAALAVTALFDAASRLICCQILRWSWTHAAVDSCGSLTVSGSDGTSWSRATPEGLPSEPTPELRYRLRRFCAASFCLSTCLSQNSMSRSSLLDEPLDFRVSLESVFYV